MSRSCSLSWMVLVLVLLWNGPSCQADPEPEPEPEGDHPPSGIGALVQQGITLAREATKIHWHPLQPCWGNIVTEVRENCPDGFHASCFNPAATSDLGVCLQQEITSNGANLWQLVLHVAKHHNDQDEDEDGEDGADDDGDEDDVNEP